MDGVGGVVLLVREDWSRYKGDDLNVVTKHYINGWTEETV